jgi:isopenicillin-N epimerase
MVATRREFLSTAAGIVSAGAVLGTAACEPRTGSRIRLRRRARDDWDAIRARIPVSHEYIQLAGLLLSSHPAPVSAAVFEHRQALDEHPALNVGRNRRRLEREARQAAADYLGVEYRDLALTDSTTMGIALVYATIAVRPGQELLVSPHDYYSTRESLRFRAARSEAVVREIPLFAEVSTATADEIVDSVVAS